MVKHSLFNRW